MKEVRGLKEWLNVIAKLDLPSLNSVVKAICELSDEDESSADQFTQIVLRDADLTSQVLKVANSMQYNRSFNSIKTVSRAIIQIGYVNLKNIALASTLIDGFLDGQPRRRLIQCLAESFHAAVQARSLAQQFDGGEHEEVFIAALLLRVGDLALMATGRPEVETFMAARDQTPLEAHSLAVDHLGVGVNTLNRALIREWGLGDLVIEASEKSNSSNPLARSVQLGDEISRTLSLGIDHPDMKNVIERVSQFSKKEIADVREHIILMSEEASSVAATYGAERLIPELPNRQIMEAESASQTDKTDYDIQRYLNRMSRCIMEGEPMPTLLQLAVRSLNRGSGFSRVTIWLNSARERRLEPVIVACEDAEKWRPLLKINLDKMTPDESLAIVVRNPKPVRFSAQKPANGVLKSLMVGSEGMLVPLRSAERLVGLIYADDGANALSDRQFEEAQLVANQVNMYLKFTLNNKK